MEYYLATIWCTVSFITDFDHSFVGLQRAGRRLRRLSNILGCRDPEYATPSASRSTPSGFRSTPSGGLDDDLDDETTSAARMDGETEEDYHARSAYMLKPRKAFHRYTPDDYTNKGKNKAVEDEAPRRSGRRSRAIDYDDADEEVEEEVTRAKKPPRRGRGPRPRTRGR